MEKQHSIDTVLFKSLFCIFCTHFACMSGYKMGSGSYLCSVTLQLCNEKYTIVPHMLFQEETAMQQNESEKHTKAPYSVRVIPPSKNAAQENADRIRCGKMLGRLMQLSEEMQGRESPKKRRI